MPRRRNGARNGAMSRLVYRAAGSAGRLYICHGCLDAHGSEEKSDGISSLPLCLVVPWSRSLSHSPPPYIETQPPQRRRQASRGTMRLAGMLLALPALAAGGEQRQADQAAAHGPKERGEGSAGVGVGGPHRRPGLTRQQNSNGNGGGGGRAGAVLHRRPLWRHQLHRARKGAQLVL